MTASRLQWPRWRGTRRGQSARTPTTMPPPALAVQMNLECPPIIKVDDSVLSLVFEEALSNALKFQRPKSQLHLTARLERGRLPGAAVAREGTRIVEPLTAVAGESEVGSREGAEDVDADKLWLHVSLENSNREGIPALDDAACAAVLRKGHKGSRRSKVEEVRTLIAINRHRFPWTSAYCHHPGWIAIDCHSPQTGPAADCALPTSDRLGSTRDAAPRATGLACTWHCLPRSRRAGSSA